MVNILRIWLYRSNLCDNETHGQSSPIKVLIVREFFVIHFLSQNHKRRLYCMNLFTLFVTAVGLSMDAFAVAICKGLALKKISVKNACLVGLWFGGFQALMPLIGYLVGTRFQNYVVAVDHWIAFVLLIIIGGNMIKESLSKEEEQESDSLSVKAMFPLAIATSIDALAVGITYAFLQVDIIPAVSFIGIITFLLSSIGVKVGNVFGTKYKSKAELAGGIVLTLIGVKILLEHLGILG